MKNVNVECFHNYGPIVSVIRDYGDSLMGSCYCTKCGDIIGGKIRVPSRVPIDANKELENLIVSKIESGKFYKSKEV